MRELNKFFWQATGTGFLALQLALVACDLANPGSKAKNTPETQNGKKQAYQCGYINYDEVKKDYLKDYLHAMNSSGKPLARAYEFVENSPVLKSCDLSTGDCPDLFDESKGFVSADACSNTFPCYPGCLPPGISYESRSVANQVKEQDEIVGKFENHLFDKGGKSNWHYVEISAVDADTFRWQNQAGHSWLLHRSNFPNMYLVDENSPYYGDGHKILFIKRGGHGDVVAVVGPWDEIYRKNQAPQHYPLGRVFTDENITAGVLSGTLTFQAAADESDIDDYVVYWGKDTSTDGIRDWHKFKAPYDQPIAILPKTGNGSIMSYQITSLSIPVEDGFPSSYFFIVPRNSSGECLNCGVPAFIHEDLKP